MQSVLLLLRKLFKVEYIFETHEIIEPSLPGNELKLLSTIELFLNNEWITVENFISLQRDQSYAFVIYFLGDSSSSFLHLFFSLIYFFCEKVIIRGTLVSAEYMNLLRLFFAL